MFTAPITGKARGSAERVAAVYERGTCEQGIKEGKGAIKWTRPLYRSSVANAVHLQLHAITFDLRNFMRTPAMPEALVAARTWALDCGKA
jgi:hypothetical protein